VAEKRKKQRGLLDIVPEAALEAAAVSGGWLDPASYDPSMLSYRAGTGLRNMMAGTAALPGLLGEVGRGALQKIRELSPEDLRGRAAPQDTTVVDAASALARRVAQDPGAAASKVLDYGRGILSSPGNVVEFLGENITPRPRGPTSNRKDIFIGKSAKTWDAAAAKRAEEMEAAGVDSKTIWSETGTFRAPDGQLRQEISDVGARLAKESEEGFPANVAFEHPGGLFDAYPEIGQRTTIRTNQALEGGASGSYNRNTQSVNFGETARQSPDELTSIGLHELQHAVQQREAFGRGGMPELARRFLQEDMQRRYAPYASDLGQRSRASALSGDAYRAQYAQHLENLQRKDNIKPRELTRMSDWYKYGSKISQQMAEDGYGWQMPAKAGANRDFWIRGAVRRMQRMIEADRPDMRNAKEIMPPDEAKKILRKTDKVFRKTQESAIAANKIDDLKRTLEAKSDYELYRRLGGEAEARLTEQRMRLTPQQRQEIFPEYDVPMNEIIITRR
jgi:hypothetical protein